MYMSHCAITGNHNSQQDEMAGLLVAAGLVANAEKKKTGLSWSLNRLQVSLYRQAGGTGSKYN